MLVFLQEPASRSIWYGKTLLLKLNGVVIIFCIFKTFRIPEMASQPPLESTMKRKPSQGFATVEFKNSVVMPALQLLHSKELWWVGRLGAA